MKQQIDSIIKKYKSGSSPLEDIKAELLEISGNIQADALLALLFGVVGRKGFAVSEGDNCFLAVINGNVLNPGCEVQRENILIYKNKIVATSSNLPDTLPDGVESLQIIDAKGMTITPGLIDQHIHGGYGFDFNRTSVEEILELSACLPRHGITAIVPTVMTASEEVVIEQINRVKTAKSLLREGNTRFLGIHLEGPFLSPKNKGIHPESSILAPTVENFKHIEDSEIKIVTYAPELDEGFKLTRYLAEKNIIPSAGHTNASVQVIKEAVSCGLKQVTHLFNAMAPLHHRKPGVIGEALVNDDLYVEFIADGLHLDPIIIDIILRAKPDSKVIFISDSLPLNSARCDSVTFAGQEIFNKDNKAVNKDGTFAGSLIFLDSALRNVVGWNLASFSQALRFTSINTAQNLGLTDMGYIENGKLADIVIWDDELNVETTIINGKTAFKR